MDWLHGVNIGKHCIDMWVKEMLMVMNTYMFQENYMHLYYNLVYSNYKLKEICMVFRED